MGFKMKGSPMKRNFGIGSSPAKNYKNPQDYKVFNMGNKPSPFKQGDDEKLHTKYADGSHSTLDASMTARRYGADGTLLSTSTSGTPITDINQQVKKEMGSENIKVEQHLGKEVNKAYDGSKIDASKPEGASVEAPSGPQVAKGGTRTWSEGQAASGGTLNDLVAKRKTLEKGSDEWKRVQNQINEALGSSKRYDVGPAEEEKTDERTISNVTGNEGQGPVYGPQPEGQPPLSSEGTQESLIKDYEPGGIYSGDKDGDGVPDYIQNDPNVVTWTPPKKEELTDAEYNVKENRALVDDKMDPRIQDAIDKGQYRKANRLTDKRDVKYAKADKKSQRQNFKEAQKELKLDQRDEIQEMRDNNASPRAIRQEKRANRRERRANRREQRAKMKEARQVVRRTRRHGRPDPQWENADEVD